MKKWTVLGIVVLSLAFVGFEKGFFDGLGDYLSVAGWGWSRNPPK